MNPVLRRILWVAALLACLVTIFFAVRGGLALGAPPVTAAPPSATSTATPPSTAGTATGQATPSETPSPSLDPAAAVMSGPAAPWDAITAAPTHIEVFVGQDRLIGATISPVQMRDDGELNPVPQTVGWYGPPQWDTTPGERSQYPGVLAGHVIHSGLKDVFWNLQELPAGAVVLLTYDDGTQAVFRTDRPAETMDKDDLTHDPAYGWAWELPEVGHGLTLITCDLVDGSGMTGWSTDNWVTQAHRIA